MRCLYRIAPDALADLDDIWTYIAEDNIAAANRLLDRLHEKFAMLSRQPLLGELREELGADYRSFHVGRYVIYYRPMRGTATIEVGRVIHGARDISSLF